MDKSSRRAALLVACLASFMPPFTGSSVNVALPAVGAQFSASAVQLGWVATGYHLAAAMFLLPFGRMADILGRKRILTVGVVTYTVSSLLAITSPSAAFLIAARVVQGIGGAMMFGTSVAILTAEFPAKDRGRVLGLSTASVYFGLSVGPFFGGLLTEHFGWKSVFLANVPLGILLLVVMPGVREQLTEAKGQRFDYPGSVMYGLALATIMYGLSLLPSIPGGVVLLLGGMGIFAFLGWESRTPSPVLDIRLLRDNSVFVFSNLAALINYSATTAVGFLLSLYLQYIKGLGADVAGLVLVSQPIVMAVFSPFAGRLSDRVEPRIVASTGMSLNCAGLIMLSLMGENTPVALIVLSLLLMGMGFALFSSPNTNAVMSSVEHRYYGVASATLSTMRTTGQMLSLAIAMLVFALFIGNVKIEPQYYPLFLTSVRTAFAVFAFLCFGGIFASLARGKLRPN